ncbi:hypothetical protein COCON_G00113470 [Conger conger]|uniref:B box-type domain-containing protein n=1 Tax=Conger conger TaxID=82655 RepID=A0A9Q1DG50_CONCO|nr:hypothetical protein COCON_G00113470 [Conger conger]
MRCPECRESMRCSAPLQRNYRLANIAEDYRQRGRPRPVPAPSPAPVPCDLCCPGDAAGAVKTCLQCEVSMCAEHLRPHLERPAFRTHPLAQPLGDARQRKCPAHDELYRYYCPQDRALLCQACTIEGQHAGHGLQTLKNTMRDLKEALQVQGQRLNRRISRSEKFLQLRADAERDSQCVRAHSGAGPGAELQRCGGRMAEDRAQLQQAQSSLQALLQQNDPFLFVQEYHSTGKMLRRALKRPLSSPGSVCLDREALVEAMEAKLEEFQTEFRLQISDLIHTVGLETDGEEEEEGREEEVEEEEEDESESDEDEDGDEEDEIRSEGMKRMITANLLMTCTTRRKRRKRKMCPLTEAIQRLCTEALQVQGQRLNRRISRSEKFLQLRADAERDSQRFVEGAEQQVQVVGGQVQGQLGLFLSALRECVRAHSGAGPGAELQRCGGRMAEDRAQLQQAQSSLQALLQQNDPFLFVQEYHSTGKMLRRALKRPLSSPGSVCLDREALVEAMEAKLEEFQTEFRLQISDLIHTVGLLNTAPQDGGREEEEGESESEDEDEDGDPVDEIRSEGDEEDDHNQSADGLCKPEEEEKEEDMSSD